MGQYQDTARQLYAERGYTNDPMTLTLGVCEEAGELAKAINWFHNPLYKNNKASQSGSPEHEMHDLLIYLAALANSLNIDLGI